MAKRRAQGSLFRRTRNGKPEAVWTISYHAAGRRITERAYTDKAASEQLLAQRQREAARDEVGLGDPYRKHRSRSLRDHLDDFLAGIAARNRTKKHRSMMRARLLCAFEGMGAGHLTDLDLSRGEQFLGQLLDDGKSVKTRDHYAMSLRQFGAWLVDTERAPRNYFHRLRNVARQSDVTLERMALKPDQLWKLIQAAEARPVARYRETHPQALPETFERLARNGRRRAALYLFSAMTGLRRSECVGIRWIDIDLSESGGWVRPRAKTAKSRRVEPLPIDERLRQWLVGMRADMARDTGRVPPGKSCVFHVPKNLPEQLRKDAEYADVPVVDELGRKLDFHALRTTLGTMLARSGVALQKARKLMRHSSAATTAKHYEKLDPEDLRADSDLMAAAFWEEAVTAQVTANATDHDASGRTDVPSEDEPKRGVTG
tara:strand:+ start:29747 stop:31039 length:1293 start_codon:yes stop_codon:yes gene_type:complete